MINQMSSCCQPRSTHLSLVGSFPCKGPASKMTPSVSWKKNPTTHCVCLFPTAGPARGLNVPASKGKGLVMVTSTQRRTPQCVSIAPVSHFLKMASFLLHLEKIYQHSSLHSPAISCISFLAHTPASLNNH